MDENKIKFNLKMLENASNNLRKNGFNSSFFENRQKALDYILNLIGENKKVAFGGSITAEEMRLKENLNKNEIITHTPQMDLEERRKVWLKAMDSDFYIASPQAITLDGKLIFIDGTGNRCAAITWGPRHLLIIAGVNKIVKDSEEGFYRMRNISAISNNIRLNKKNPCVKTGKCEDCSSPERICNIVTILWKKPKIANCTVILINEELGY